MDTYINIFTKLGLGICSAAFCWALVSFLINMRLYLQICRDPGAFISMEQSKLEKIEARTSFWYDIAAWAWALSFFVVPVILMIMSSYTIKKALDLPTVLCLLISLVAVPAVETLILSREFVKKINKAIFFKFVFFPLRVMYTVKAIMKKKNSPKYVDIDIRELIENDIKKNQNRYKEASRIYGTTKEDILEDKAEEEARRKRVAKSRARIFKEQPHVLSEIEIIYNENIHLFKAIGINDLPKDESEISHAYREFAKKYHSDNNGDSERFIAGTKAYEKIKELIKKS